MLQFSIIPITKIAAESNVVIFSYEDSQRPVDTFLFGSFIENAFSSSKLEGFDGKFGQISLINQSGSKKRILFVGLGKRSEISNDSLRKMGGALAKKAQSLKLKSLSVRVPVFTQIKESAQAFTEGFILGSYQFNEFKSKQVTFSVERVSFISKDQNEEREIKKGQNIGKIFGESVCFARNLINRPPSDTTPEYMSKIALGLKSSQISVKVLNKSQIKKLGMGALLGVNRGSHEPPYFIHLTYKPKGKVLRTIGICGKGITFDSGGLSLKPAQSMETMKYDMAGAASVFSLFKALKELQPSVEVHGFTPLTENMPGGNALKPGDVLKTMRGKTIEVLNTDAEGRLVLADALTYACKQNLDEVMDIATLTGACVVALGTGIVGLLGINDDFKNRVKQASEKAGEKVWELPLEKEYLPLLKSHVADIKNIGPAGQAGTIMAGLFLQEFVDKDLPWVHLDIASSGWANSSNSLVEQGATGVMIRTLLTYLTSYN
ncbi:MAG: leucyl aminopeptidase [Elusimicrobiota bacterium]